MWNVGRVQNRQERMNFWKVEYCIWIALLGEGEVCSCQQSTPVLRNKPNRRKTKTSLLKSSFTQKDVAGYQVALGASFLWSCRVFNLLSSALGSSWWILVQMAQAMWNSDSKQFYAAWGNECLKISRQKDHVQQLLWDAGSELNTKTGVLFPGFE